MFKQTHKLSKFHLSVQHQSGSETSYQNYLYHSKLKDQILYHCHDQRLFSVHFVEGIQLEHVVHSSNYCYNICKLELHLVNHCQINIHD